MYHGDDSRPEDLAADNAMTALYRQLDQHDLPADTPFDTEAGLRDLTSRIDRELVGRARQDHGRLPEYAAPAEPSEKTPEDALPSPGKGRTSGSPGLKIMAAAAMAAGWYLRRRWAQKMPPQSHPRSFDPTPGSGKQAHWEDERL